MFFCDLRFLLSVFGPYLPRAPKSPSIHIVKGLLRFAPCKPVYAPKMRPRLRACLCRLLHFICALQAFLRRSASIPHPSRTSGVCSARACITCYILSSCQVMMKNPAKSHTACSFACIFCFHVVYIVAGKHIPASPALVSDFMPARWQTIAASHMYDRRAVVSFSAVGGRKV